MDINLMLPEMPNAFMGKKRHHEMKREPEQGQSRVAPTYNAIPAIHCGTSIDNLRFISRKLGGHCGLLACPINSFSPPHTQANLQLSHRLSELACLKLTS